MGWEILARAHHLHEKLTLVSELTLFRSQSSLSFCLPSRGGLLTMLFSSWVAAPVQRRGNKEGERQGKGEERRGRRRRREGRATGKGGVEGKEKVRERE